MYRRDVPKKSRYSRLKLRLFRELAGINTFKVDESVYDPYRV